MPLLVADARACCGRRRGGDEAWRKRRFERVQMEGTRDAPAARRQWHHKMTTRDPQVNQMWLLVHFHQNKFSDFKRLQKIYISHVVRVVPGAPADPEGVEAPPPL